MQASSAYQVLAAKYLHTKTFSNVVILDSFIKLLTYTFTEEEAEIVSNLGFAVKNVKAISKKINRPAEEIEPILKSLADRVLIVGLTNKKVPLYGLLNFYPGIYEAQMVMSEVNMRDGNDGAFYKEFARLFKDFWDEFFAWMRNDQEFAEKYQILGVPLGRIISIEQAIEATPGLGILTYPTDKFSEMADRAKKSIAHIDVCTCRQEIDLLGEKCKKVPSSASVTCTITGIAAEGAIKAGMATRMSKEEFIEARMQAGEMGLVAMVDDTIDPLLVCSCCDCCCSILRVLKKFNRPNMWAQSHFEAEVDTEKCTGCKKCETACPMDAIIVKDDKKAGVDYAKCIGCGVCVIKCDKNKAVTFRERKVHKPPCDNMAEFWVRRYFEIKNKEDNLFPKLTLGATRVLSKINPVHITGPRARKLK